MVRECILRRLVCSLVVILLTLSPYLAPARAAAQARQLQPGPAMLFPRAAHTATTLADGRVLIAGGCTADSCDLTADGATTEIFDPARNVFVAGPTLSTPRVSHSSLLLPDDRVLLVGGWTPDGPTTSTELFDPATDTITPGPAMATPRADAVLALLMDGRVLIAGGYDGKAPLASTEIYDPERNTIAPAGDMTTPRTSHAGVTLNDGRVLLAGGSDRDDHVIASAEIYDPDTGTFAPTGEMAIARYKFGVVRLGNGHVLVVAGTDERDAGGALASTELYDPASGGFRPGPTLRHARYKIAGSLVVVPDDGVLITGGADAVELLSLSDSEELAPALGAALSFPTASLVADGRVLIAGGYDTGLHVSRQTWLFQPT